MMKENKGKTILTSLIIFVPVVLGLILWKKLPEQIPTHWNFEGVVDGWSSKAFAVFGIPMILLGVHLLCLGVSSHDPKRKNYASQLLGVVFWICPVVSLMMMVISYGTALGMKFAVDKIMLIICGVMFIFVGNYMPKCKQNYTMGIKLPWTLHDVENWNYTHRIGGRTWLIIGVLSIVAIFLPAKLTFVVFFILAMAAVMIPTIASYCFYRKKEKEDGE